MNIPKRMTKGKGLVVRERYLKPQGGTAAEIKEKWNLLKDGLEHICKQNTSALVFQDLHKAAYIIVRANKGKMLYEETEKTLKSHIQGLRDRLMENPNTTFLRELYKAWEIYRVSIERVRDIYMYMDRAYVPQNNKLSSYKLGISLFGTEVFSNKTIVDRIMKLILEWIELDRKGEMLKVETNKLLKSLTNMMVEIDEKLYMAVFEKQYLNQTEIYYTKYAAESFENDPTIVYLKKVVTILEEEVNRAKKCMHKETPTNVKELLERVMIDKYKHSIVTKSGTGCKIMLENWQYDNLRIVYTIVGKVKGGLVPLQSLVHEQCVKQGKEITQSTELDENPIDMIQALLDLYDNYQELLDISFSSLKHKKVIVRNPTFSKIVKTAWDEIVRSTKDNRFEEYLSLFIDSKLKKGKHNLSDIEFDSLFNGVVRLLHHSKDKDMFEQYYKMHLSKRLLSHKSQSDDAEKNIIAKLKGEFGYSFTSKLEGMFNDTKKSKLLQQDYNTHIRVNNLKPSFELSVQILTAGFWGAGHKINVGIPAAIQQATDMYSRFYSEKYTSRQLNWQYTLGTADVRANGFSQPYELNVNTLQMLILLLFNENKHLTFQNIAEEIKVPSKHLSSSLMALTLKSKSHGRILKKKNRDGTKKMNPSTVITPNNEFMSKLVKVKVSPIVYKQNKEQKQETVKMINEERRTVLDSVIVRIMKMYKQMRHQQLLMEVTKQVQSRFQPVPGIIKKCIESLIDREYMRRDDEDRGLFHYIA